MDDQTGFVHLQVHSYYSFLDSTLSPGDIMRAALATGARAVALTDTNCLSGIIEFIKIAQEAGIHPVIGAELRQPLPGERRMLNARNAVGGVAPQLDEDDTDSMAGEDATAPPQQTGLVSSSRKSASSIESVPSMSPALCHGDPAQRAILLARNFDGYSEISRICTRRMLNSNFDLYRELRGLSGNVIVLSDCVAVLHELARRPAPRPDAYGILIPSRRRRRENRCLYQAARDLGLPLVVTCDVKLGTPSDAKFHSLLQAMRRLTTVQQIAAADQIDPAQHFQPEAAIREFFGLATSGEDTSGSDADTRALREAIASAMANTTRIAAQCQCQLPLGEWKFPRIIDSATEATKLLRGYVYDGLAWRYGSPLPPEVIQRAEYELSVIESNHFTNYFLLVRRIVAEARARNFYIVGRGSAANSIVSYSLGITNVCPIKHDLYFERFLNPERSVPPDIDIDFSWKERDEILQWCFEFFGQDHVALISTIQTFKHRQAVRETAKALGISEGELSQYSRLTETGYKVEEAVGAPANGGAGPRAPRRRVHDLSRMEPWRTVLELSARLHGFPHHFSVHCGGIVITPSPVTDWVPLTRSAKGYAVTQYDMYSAEDLGLIKIDLLGNRSLGVLKDAIVQAERNRQRDTEGEAGERAAAGATNVQASPRTINTKTFQREAVRMKMAGTRRGTTVALIGALHNLGDGKEATVAPAHATVEELAFDFSRITSDPATRAMIDEGRTMGCFYIESPGMRALFERLRCKSYEEVVAASSIIRPGVAESGMMQEYIARHKAGGENRSSQVNIMPLMQEILPETHGVMVYQEDVLRVAHKVAGLTYGQADLLRRAMSGKHRSEDGISKLENDFVEGAVAHGVHEENAREIWRQIASFAGYSFCKGHSAAFAVLSYQVAWLKAHHPAEFFAGLLTNQGGFYGAGAYLQEARRWGVAVQGPCINASENDYTGLSCEDDGRTRGHLRVGLLAVQNLSTHTRERILQARKTGGEFRSLADFLRRTGTGLEECRTLIKAGAMDCLGWGTAAPQLRPELLFQAASQMKSGAVQADDLLPGEAVSSVNAVIARRRRQRHAGRCDSASPFSLRELCGYEMETLGFYLSAHPVQLVRVPKGVVAARDIRKHDNERVRMVGHGIATKLLATRNSGKLMKMLTLEDTTDTFEAVLFPRVYDRFAPRTLGTGPYLVEGKVDMTLGSPTINVEKVEVLALI
jgi:DNA-directed DNA polymerase III PolC